MNQATRIEKIESIISRPSEIFGNQEIPWRDTLTQFNVYKIPSNILYITNITEGFLVVRAR